MSVKKAYLYVFYFTSIDQISKVYVKTNFTIGESVTVLTGLKYNLLKTKEWLEVLELPGDYGKLALTLFRIIAVGGLAWWL